MEIITALGLVAMLCYIALKMNARVQEDKKDLAKWTITCMESYVTAVNYKPSCREVLAYQRATGR